VRRRTGDVVIERRHHASSVFALAYRRLIGDAALPNGRTPVRFRTGVRRRAIASGCHYFSPVIFKQEPAATVLQL
jgi:hypothetical protein